MFAEPPNSKPSRRLPGRGVVTADEVDPEDRKTARAFVGLRGSAYGKLRCTRHPVMAAVERLKHFENPTQPRIVDGAEWQTGVTDGNERLRITLDGQAVVAAIAASETAGWVEVVWDRDESGAVDPWDELVGIGRFRRRLTGDVRIVADQAN